MPNPPAPKPPSSTSRPAGLDLAALVRSLEPRLLATRRDLHRHPELGFEEVRTASVVADWCRGLGLEVKTGVAKTGVVARLRGARPGRTIALRADMDALPVQEATDRPWSSETPNRMHACGHDAHVTMALGAATVLAGLREQLSGDVVFLFQPAEEGPGGAKPMIEAGALEGVDLVIGQHVQPQLPTGTVGLAVGPFMAAADLFDLTVVGEGGHGAWPHLSIDPIPIAAQIVTALQTIVSRTVDPLQAAVVSIGTIQGGFRSNVVADRVVMTGTVRTFEPALRDAVERRIGTIASNVAAAHGARAILEYHRTYPAVVNHAAPVELVRRVAATELGVDFVRDFPASMGGEDFAYYLHRVPGCFYWLGVGGPAEALGKAPRNLHSPTFDLDEAALSVGVRVYARVALDVLSDETIRRP